MKTNFEKWKEELKPEDACNLIELCGSCPAKQYCIDNPNTRCEDAFDSWANLPAKENEE